MVLTTEPAGRSRAASRMRAVVAFITGLALIAAGLDVTLASPASAQVLRRAGIVVGAADNAHHINAAATEVVIEAELKAPPRCRKHACRAAPSKTIAIEVLLVNVLAGQGERTTAICAEFASGPAVAGGDPVNRIDPGGLITCPSVLPGCGVVTSIQNLISGNLKIDFNWLASSVLGQPNRPLLNGPSAQPVYSQPPQAYAGDPEAWADLNVDRLWDDTLGLPDAWDAPSNELSRMIGASTVVAVLLLFYDEYDVLPNNPTGAESIVTNSNAISAQTYGTTTGWVDWQGSLSHGFFVLAFSGQVEALTLSYIAGLPLAGPWKALASQLVSDEVSASITPSATTNAYCSSNRISFA